MKLCEVHFPITRIRLVLNIPWKALSGAYHHSDLVWCIITYLAHTRPPYYISYTTSRPLLPTYLLGNPPPPNGSPGEEVRTHSKKYCHVKQLAQQGFFNKEQKDLLVIICKTYQYNPLCHFYSDHIISHCIHSSL